MQGTINNEKGRQFHMFTLIPHSKMKTEQDEKLKSKR